MALSTAAIFVAVGLGVGALAVAVMLRPRWCLVLLAAAVASNAASVVGDRVSPGLYFMALALSTGALALGIVRQKVRLRYSTAFLLFALFIVSQLPSVVVAVDSAAATGGLIELVKDGWLLVLVVLLASTMASAWTIARVLVATLAVLALLTLVDQFILHGATSFGGFSVVSDSTGVGAATPRYSGAFDDPNFWGRVLLLAAPLSLSLVLDAWSRSARNAAAGWATAFALIVGGIYLTQSRGTLLGLGCGLVMWCLLTGPRQRKLLYLAPVALVALLALPGVGSRLASLDDLSGLKYGEGDYALVERAATQQISLAIFADNPVVGIGIANIPARWEDYDDRADIVVQRVVAPHNLYLQFAAETGLIGLSGWLLFVVGIMVIGGRIIISSPLPSGTPQVSPPRMLAAGALASLVSWSVASVFLHLAFLRPLLLVVAILAILALHTPRRPATLSELTEMSGRGAPRQALVGVGALVTVVALGAATVLAVRQPVWVVQVPVTILPSPDAKVDIFVDAYTYDIITRPIIIPTYAAVIEQTGTLELAGVGGSIGKQGRYDVTTLGASSRAVVIVQARGPDLERTGQLARDVAQLGSTYANAQPALRALAAARTGTPTVSRDTRLAFSRAIPMFVVAAGLGLLALGYRLWSRRRPGRPAERSS